MAGTDEHVIGIDLGTTYSCVAIYRYGQAEVIENQLGGRVTPSMVAFTKHDRLVGIAAKNQAATNPTNTISEVKRLVGRSFHDPIVHGDLKFWPFQVVEGIGGKPMIKVNEQGEDVLYTAEQISAMVLGYLKDAASKRLGREVKNAVITVPAYFNDAQRCATRDAAAIAGLNALRIINEPTAAALAYGLDKTRSGQVGKRNVLIFDLGGGTFDVTVLEIENGVMGVKATLGDTHLGGADFDNRLMRHFAQELARAHGPDASSNPKVLRRLRTECEKTKRMLSTSTHGQLNVESLFAGEDFVADISRAKFQSLNEDLLDRCIDLVEQCLSDAKLEKNSIHDVVLVGGSSRIPKIQDLLSEFFGRDNMCSNVNPDEAVACGAAIQAAMLTGGTDITDSLKQFLVLKDVTPLSLGIELNNGDFAVLIPRNTPIPCHKQDEFSNAYDKQKRVTLSVYEGEAVVAKKNNLLGQFAITGFKPRSEGKVKFDVTFDIDANGILNVTAIERKSKITAAITITDQRGRLSVEERDRMINEAKAYNLEVQRKAQVALAKEGLDTLAYDLQSKVKSRAMRSIDASLRERMLASIAEALEWSESNKSTASAYQDKKSALQRSWDAFIVNSQLPRQ